MSELNDGFVEQGPAPVERGGSDDAASALQAQAAEIERLHERLEDNHLYEFNEAGEEVRVEVKPGSIPDGIECRNETIKIQDENIDRLRKRIAELEAARDATRRKTIKECGDMIHAEAHRLAESDGDLVVLMAIEEKVRALKYQGEENHGEELATSQSDADLPTAEDVRGILKP